VWERESHQSGCELAGGVVGVDDVDVLLQAESAELPQGCAIEQRAPAEHQYAFLHVREFGRRTSYLVEATDVALNA